jgi:predicted TIM-barrel fold metal-dependent hydrolase
MLGDYFIADGVIHGYNWTQENFNIPEARFAAMGGFGGHRHLSPNPAWQLDYEDWQHDWQISEIEEAAFLEAGSDIVAYHGTPIRDLWKDGHSADWKGAEWKAREPERVIYYGGANPLDGKKSFDELKRNRDNGAEAVKIYPAWYDGHGVTHRISLDDPEFGYPFIEKAIELGYKTIATHKAIPFGPVDIRSFDLMDIPAAAGRYPEVNFEILHAGFAFVEETVLVLQSFPENTYVNFEGSNSLLLAQPKRFAHFLGQFYNSGAEDRMIISSGMTMVHSRPVFDAIINFEMPEDLVRDYGYPVVTKEMKQKLLGGNLMKLHGRDIPTFMKSVEGDYWDQRQKAEGTDHELWSHYHARKNA